MRILMLEDNPTFVSVVRSEFLFDCTVDVVSTVADARGTLQLAFDSLLVDYDLPDGKGDTYVREARTRGFKGTIVAISSHDRGNKALLEAGADLACPKNMFSELRRMLGLS